MAFQAGAYTIKVTTNSVTTELGLTEAGFNASLRPSLIPIRTDEFARSIIDLIFAGLEVGYVRADIIHGSGSGTITPAILFPWLTVGTLNLTPGTCMNATNCVSTLLLESKITAQTDYSFGKALCMNMVRNFSSTRLVTWSVEYMVYITSSTGVLFTNP